MKLISEKMLSLNNTVSLTRSIVSHWNNFLESLLKLYIFFKLIRQLVVLQNYILTYFREKK